jgi:Leucine-rich repeat (LRR) protein
MYFCPTFQCQAEKIENLDCNLELKYLDLSSNNISKVDDISKLQGLESLMLKENHLSRPDSIRYIVNLKSLRELDLSRNQIECNLEDLLDVLSHCKSLEVLILKGNPVVATKYYRKIVISKCQRLNLLDGNRISNEERMRCTAWRRVLDAGGSFDEADEAENRGLKNIQANVARRNSQRGIVNATNGSGDVGHSSKRSIGSSFKEGIKRAFGLVSIRSSGASYVSFSSSS